MKKTSSNINRFVRDISFKVIQSIFDAQISIKEESSDYINSLNSELANMVSKGLEDNWSEIRYAASHSVRSFYGIAKNNQQLRDIFDKVFIPRICLNRYYEADGVQIFSQ